MSPTKVRFLFIGLGSWVSSRDLKCKGPVRSGAFPWSKRRRCWKDKALAYDKLVAWLALPEPRPALKLEDLATDMQSSKPSKHEPPPRRHHAHTHTHAYIMYLKGSREGLKSPRKFANKVSKSPTREHPRLVS